MDTRDQTRALGRLGAVGRLAGNLVVVAGAVLLGTVVAGGRAAAAPASLGLVTQTFNVASTGTLDLTVSVPTGVAAPLADFSVTVTAFRPVDTRDAVAAAIAGTLPRSVDTVDVAAAAITRPAAGQLHLSVPIEVLTRTPAALQLTKAGLYPLLVELREGPDVVADVLTFVHRLPTAQEDPELPMPVAMTASTDTAVVLDDHARVTIGNGVLREMGALADLLEASAVPIAVRVPPSLLAALADSGTSGAALADRLSQAMQRHELLSSPVLPLDPSAAAAAGQQALYTQWLRDGEDSLGKSIAATAQRTIVLVDQPLSEAGGALLRDLGARLLVIPPRLYDGLPNTVATFTDTTQLVQIQVSPGVTLDATIIDRVASQELARVTTTPQLSAIYAVADLLAARQQVEDQGGDPRRHSVTLATPDLTLPSATGIGAFTKLLAVTPGLRPTTLDDLSVRTDELLNGEGPVVVNLPTNVDGDIGARMTLTGQLGLESVSMSSMVPSDDPRVAEWNRLISALPTSALTDTQAAAIAAGIRGEFSGLKGAIGVPVGFAFNLTGNKGTVPLNLHNSSDIALKVRVRMSSSKLLFPDGDQTVTLLPDSFTHIQISIDARTNGRFPVALEVFTPLGDTRLAPVVPLTASINALSGVGTLVTGAALLVLLTWWVRHIRKNRRVRRAVEAANRHPATRTDSETDLDTDAPTAESRATTALSPDAETSTLPPS